MVWLRGTILATAPPTSIPSDSGVTSSNSTSSFCPAREQVRLHRRPERHHLVGIDVAQRLLLEHLGHVAPDRRHPRGPAHQDDAVERLGLEPRVLQRAPTGDARALEQRSDRCVESGPA